MTCVCMQRYWEREVEPKKGDTAVLVEKGVGCRDVSMCGAHLRII